MPDAAKYRYPGPPEFEDTPGDRRRFFGRATEINNVSERVVASRLLVIYGNSGLGKSSLLKAGVFPKLRAEGLLPIRVRLDRSVNIGSLMRAACQETARDVSRQMEIDYTPGADGSAWEFFKTVMFWHGDTLLMPVLVFDQFEEIFTLADAAWRKEFAREIGPLATGNAPAEVRDKLKSGVLSLNDQPPKVKIVFCLREEYYGSLQELSADFPGLFQDRFRLQPLDTKQAELAIVEPARLAADPSSPDGFITPPFEYEQGTLDSMLGFLKGASQFVEPFQLQLLCQYVEHVIVEGKQKASGQAPIVITPADLGGEDTMKQVIKRFYTDSLDHLPPGERRRARELCDSGLLSESGHRLMLQEDQIRKDYKVSDATLRYLAGERRILRQEPRLDSTFYEISHDTIARSIFESRKWRVPRKWRLAAAVSLLFMLALCAFASWAVVEKTKAIAALKEAESQRKQAELATKQEQASQEMAEGASKEANRSRSEAEGTVAFLMGEDFLAAIRPMGKLDVFADIQKAVPCKDVERGVKYDAVGLRNLGLACLNEGDVEYRRFHLSVAGEKYEMARKHFAELAQRQAKPDDSDLADSLMRMAQVSGDQLQLNRAVDLTRESLAIQEKLAANGASSDKLARDLAENYLRMGDLRQKQRYLGEAARNFEKGVALCKAASGRSKNSTEWLYLLQDGLEGRSEVLGQQGHQQSADAAIKEAYECAKEAVKNSPFAPEARYREGAALSKLPQSAGQKPADLLKQYQEVFADVASAAAWDPENKFWERDLAATHVLMGEALAGTGDWEKAAEQYNEAIPAIERLRKIDPTNRQLKADLLVWAHESLGSAYRQQNPKFLAAIKAGSGESGQGVKRATPVESKNVGSKSNLALDEFLKAQEFLKPIVQFAPDDIELRDSEARLEAQLGEALLTTGDKAGAGEAFQVAASNIDWVLTHRPPTARGWNDKFLLFYDHIAPLRGGEKDSAGILTGYQQAIEAIKKAAALDPQEPIYKNNLALAEQQAADTLRDQGRLSQAQQHLSESERVWRELIRVPGDASYWNRLFLLFYDHVATLREKQKDLPGVAQAYVDSLEPIKKAADLDQSEPTYQNNLAVAQQKIGDQVRDQGQFDQAQAHYSESEKAWRNALRLNESAEYWNRLFLLYYDHLTTLRAKQKDQPGVLKAYQDSIEFVAKAAKLDQDEPNYQDNLALAHQQVADKMVDLGQLSQAQEHYNECEKAWHMAIQLKKSAVYWNRLYLLFYEHVENLRVKQQDEPGLVESYQKSYAAISQAVELEPKVADYRVNAARVLWKIGEKETDKSKRMDAFRLAVEDIGQGLGLLPNSPGNASKRADYQTGRYVILHNGIAPLLSEQQDKAREFSTLNEALSAAQAAVATEKDNADYLNNLADAYNSVGQAQETQGEAAAAKISFREALKALEEAGKLSPDAKTSALKDSLMKKLGPGEQ